MNEPGIGRVIDNKYELIAALGKGGMSNVWLGHDRRLDKLWAIKEIKPNVAGAQGAANRQAIIDEANFMKRLDHPAIPRVVDIIDTGDTIFVVMDYVNGRPLSRVLRQQGRPFDQADVIAWGIQLCDVLGYLHSLNPPVVYRDMKPGNVMLRDDGSVKLIDFGIAYELLPGRRGDSRRIGSAGYSAPEQIDREMHKTTPTDPRADIYALGATLYSLVTGIVPRRVRKADGSEDVELDLKPIREVNQGLSDGFEQVLLRATMRDPSQRYQTIDEMRYDLERYEELTQEYRLEQRRKLRTFWWRVRASGIALALGIACMIGSATLRNTSYDTLMHEASAARTEEVNVAAGNASTGEARTASASEAEERYAQAINIAPSRIEPYERLLEVYKADEVFTPTEERRFARIWQQYGRDLAGNDRYARLCYDVGVLYLCYYDYLGVKDQTDELLPVAATGQGAVKNATQSAVWFERALEACDPAAGDFAGLEVDSVIDEYVATQVYHTIGMFHTLFSQASREGRDATGSYLTFWQALEGAIVGDDITAPIASQSEPIVQLRLYQVAFESIASSTYLSGFMRAGVGEHDVIRMLEAVKAKTDALSDFVAANYGASGFMYDEIENGYEVARTNVSRTYKSPVAQMPVSPKRGE